MAFKDILTRSSLLCRCTVKTLNFELCISNNKYRRYCLENRISSQNKLFEGLRFHSTSSNPQNLKKQRLRNKNVNPTFKDAFANNKLKVLEIEWGQESSPKNLYPFVWLRDNCQCEKCFHPVSLSRTMILQSLQLDINPVEIKVENECLLNIKWSDGHNSKFSSEWMHERAFGEIQNSRRSMYKLDRMLWGSEILQNLPTANFHEIMTNDTALLIWLQQLEVFGFLLITNAPTEHGQVRKLVERVAFIKRTHYGAEFAVKAKSDPSNVAYSSGPLQLHTDLPYYDYKPGIQLIHCLVQYEGVGAESLIADAIYVANLLKDKHPDMFQILSSTKVDWCDIGNDEGREFYKVLQRPVICLDSHGEISRINFSQPQRDSFFNVELEIVPKWYEALKTFGAMLHDSKNCIQFKMAPGTIQSFDNTRVVHGRKGYEEGFGDREIEGCYMDWDEARSKRRVLERQLSLSSEHWCQKITNSK